MNLDRLLKLLKLANHNPNEQEASSAARAASKMLGEDNYRWLEDAKRNGGKPKTAAGKVTEATLKEYIDPRTDEIVIKITKASQIDNPRIAQLLKQLKIEVQGGPKTWNDVNRSEKAWWRSTYEPKGADESWGESTGFNWEKEFWEQERKRAEEHAKRERHRQNYSYNPWNDFKKGFYSGVDWDKPPKTPPKREPVNWSWTQQEEDGNIRYKKVYNQRIRRCTKCDYDQLTSDESNPFICYKCKQSTQK